MNNIDILYKKYIDPKTKKISRDKFLLLISSLSKNVPEIKGIEMDVVDAVFLIFDKDSDGYIDTHEFTEWWSSPKRFSYFDPEKTKLIKKAYNLFKKYSKKNSIDYDNFLKLLKDLKLDQNSSEIVHIETFEKMDENDDGVINFYEFSRWLSWF